MNIDTLWHVFQEHSELHGNLDVAAAKGAFYAGAAAAVAVIVSADADQALYDLYRDLSAYARATDGLRCPTAH